MLKIYDGKKSLMIARPCASSEEAEKWFAEYVNGQPHAVDYTCVVTAMVPRI